MTHDIHPPSNTPEDDKAPLHNALMRLIFPVDEGVTPETMRRSLEHALRADEDCEALLFEQIHILNAIVQRMIDKGVGGTNFMNEPVPDYVSYDALKVALVAQKQCRVSVDTLSKVKMRKAFCKSPVQKMGEQKEGS